VTGLRERYSRFYAREKYDKRGLFILLGVLKVLSELVLVLACIGLVFVFFGGSDNQPLAKTRDVSSLDKSSDVQVVEEQTIMIQQPVMKIESARMFSAQWIMEKNANHYMIQLRSSADKGDIYESALDFASYRPSVVFPFKKNRNGKTVSLQPTACPVRRQNTESGSDAWVQFKNRSPGFNASQVKVPAGITHGLT